MSDLKPCPFCGSPAETMDGYDGPRSLAKCPKFVPTPRRKSCPASHYFVAVDAWNRRSAPTEPEGERVEGWAHYVGGWIWDFEKADHFKPGPEDVRATLILHPPAPPTPGSGA